MASRYRSYPLDALGFTGQVLSGQTAVVTGGGSGIGGELSFLLAQLGAAVVIAEISSSGEDTVQKILSRGGQARFIHTDVSSEESVRALFDSIRDREESVHILVNNATYCPVIPLLEMSTEEWDRVIHVNLRGTFLCSRFALEFMISQQQGTIVNMFSAPAMPYLTAYTASKEAVRSMVHSLAGELEGKPIHIIGYGPGMVETPGGTAAFRKLAPLINMSYEQLSQSGFNPGYEGLIPAYDAALVLAHILCRPQEYHNQTITMEEASRKLPTADTGEDPDVLYDCDQMKELLTSVRNQSQDLLSAVEATEEEFSRLPFFVRTMARSGFRRKVGVHVQDLKALLEEIYQSSGTIIRTLEEVGAEPDQIPRAEVAQCLLHCSRIVSVLSELEQYYEEVPAEMTRFIRDEEALREVLTTCQERVRKTQSMKDAAESTRDL